MLTSARVRGLVATALLVSLLSAAFVSNSSGRTPVLRASTAHAATKTWQIAVLVGLGSNAYQGAGVAAIKAAAAANHAAVTVFDSQGNANTQYSQFQTAIT